jgi:hypothetical protein
MHGIHRLSFSSCRSCIFFLLKFSLAKSRLPFRLRYSHSISNRRMRHSYFQCGTYRVHISVERPAITTNFHEGPKYRQKDKIVPLPVVPSTVNLFFILLTEAISTDRRSQWPRGLRRGCAVAPLLGLWARIPREAWISVSCECCVLSGRGLCDELITRPEESYLLLSL